MSMTYHGNVSQGPNNSVFLYFTKKFTTKAIVILSRSSRKLSVHAVAQSKTSMFKERYLVLYQRLMRHKDFAAPQLSLLHTHRTHREVLSDPYTSLVSY